MANSFRAALVLSFIIPLAAGAKDLDWGSTHDLYISAPLSEKWSVQASAEAVLWNDFNDLYFGFADIGIGGEDGDITGADEEFSTDENGETIERDDRLAKGCGARKQADQVVHGEGGHPIQPLDRVGKCGQAEAEQRSTHDQVGDHQYRITQLRIRPESAKFGLRRKRVLGRRHDPY